MSSAALKSLSPFVRWDGANHLGRVKWIMQAKHFHSRAEQSIILIASSQLFWPGSHSLKKKKKVNKAKTLCQEACLQPFLVSLVWRAAGKDVTGVSKCFYQHDIWKAEDRTTESWGFGNFASSVVSGITLSVYMLGASTATRAVIHPNMFGIMLYRLTLWSSFPDSVSALDFGLTPLRKWYVA